MCVCTSLFFFIFVVPNFLKFSQLFGGRLRVYGPWEKDFTQ